MAEFGSISYGLTIPAQNSVIRNAWDTAYIAFNLMSAPEWTLYNWQIVTSVSSWNLTVALKTLAWTDPSPTDPVFVRIGGVVRSITSALSVNPSAWWNWCNAWSSELATKEIDIFTYLWVNNLWNIQLWISRIPYWTIYSDFSSTWDNEKYLTDFIWNTAWTNPVVNIGRFNAILSWWPSHTWSIPATSVIINRPIYETRWLDWTSVINTWTNAPTSINENLYKYKIENDKLLVKGKIKWTQNVSNSWTTIHITWPFSSSWNYHNTIFWSGFWTDNATFDEFAWGIFRWNTSNSIFIIFQDTTWRRPEEIDFNYMTQI